MPDFVALETFVRPSREPDPPPVETIEPIDDADGDELQDALCAARRFRATLDEAIEAGVAALLREIAASVVARELALAAVDVAAIVDDARRRYGIDDMLCIRAHPDEIGALRALGARVAADPRLRRGDVEIDVRDGRIDATLGARLDRVLPG